jgi:hypothetical protein
MKRYEQGSLGMWPDPEGVWVEYAEAQAEIERLRGLSDITRLDVMWQELVKERYAAENNAARLAAEVQNLRAEIERLRKMLNRVLTHWLQDDDPDELQELVHTAGEATEEK